MTPFSLCGFVWRCRPAQFAEETRKADFYVPWGLVLGCALTGVMGFGYLLVLFYCIQVAFASNYFPNLPHGIT